jgi:hypothetical protein
MPVLSRETRKIIRESFGTFIVALFGFAFAIALTFVEDFCVHTKRPAWLIIGIQILSVILFIGDGLIMFAVVARIVCRTVKDFFTDLQE